MAANTIDLTPSEPEWVSRVREAWLNKPGLRWYYQTQIYDPMIGAIKSGDALELGSGPGLFGEYYPKLIKSDLEPHNGLDLCADVMALPFADGSIDNIVAVDVLHHIAKPADMFDEVSRVLKPNGRLVMSEPWTGFFGNLFFKYVHHEDCRHVEDPWNDAFPGDKPAMDGNAQLPRLLLDSADLSKHNAELKLIALTPFGSLSYLLTGGFQGWGLGLGAIKFLAKLENALPKWLMHMIATRVLIVIEKI